MIVLLEDVCSITFGQASGPALDANRNVFASSPARAWRLLQSMSLLINKKLCQVKILCTREIVLLACALHVKNLCGTSTALV